MPRNPTPEEIQELRAFHKRTGGAFEPKIQPFHQWLEHNEAASPDEQLTLAAYLAKAERRYYMQVGERLLETADSVSVSFLKRANELVEFRVLVGALESIGYRVVRVVDNGNKGIFTRSGNNKVMVCLHLDYRNVEKAMFPVQVTGEPSHRWAAQFTRSTPAGVIIGLIQQAEEVLK